MRTRRLFLVVMVSVVAILLGRAGVSNEAQANQVSLDELYGLGFDYFQKFPREIQKVTKEYVDRVARKCFDLESYAIAIIRPPLGKRE